MINLKNLYKSFDNKKSYAVKDVSLTVEDGEILVLLGSSGSGKSTILRMINKIIEKTSGLIELNGKNIDEMDIISLRRHFGYVFQGVGLFPHMTIEENITIGPELLGWSKNKIKNRAKELMKDIGLNYEQYNKRFPEELSGGQQQRIGVARALASNPEYLLMDEPFGALDAVTRDELQKKVLEIRKESKKTIIFVTHDIFESLALGDRIAVIHEGTIQQVDEPKQIIQNPKTSFVEELFGKAIDQLHSFEKIIG